MRSTIRPANLFVADFMGSPSMNLLEGKVARNGGGARIVLERGDHAPIVVPVAAQRRRRASSATGAR